MSPKNRPESQPSPTGLLQSAAQALLSHRLALEAEQDAAEMLRAMGVAEPTGADGLLLGQYLKALKGDTSAAKFVREAAAETFADEETALAPEDLKNLPDAALYALAAEDAP